MIVERSKLLLQVHLRDLRVHRRGLHVPVAQVLLHDPEIAVRATQELRAARVPERARVEFWDPHTSAQVLDDLPDHGGQAPALDRLGQRVLQSG